MAAGVTEPVIGARRDAPDQPHQAYSIAPGDAVNPNRVAQAGHAAAHHVEANQAMEHGAAGKAKHSNGEHVARIVAEENASRSKFPHYPGLEHYELLEKMGDGAFSNVYRARDRNGTLGEVAIKVVRKFEMNSMQVSSYQTGRPLPPFLSCWSSDSLSPVTFLPFSVLCYKLLPLPTPGSR